MRSKGTTSHEVPDLVFSQAFHSVISLSNQLATTMAIEVSIGQFHSLVGGDMDFSSNSTLPVCKEGAKARGYIEFSQPRSF